MVPTQPETQPETQREAPAAEPVAGPEAGQPAEQPLAFTPPQPEQSTAGSEPVIAAPPAPPAAAPVIHAGPVAAPVIEQPAEQQQPYAQQQAQPQPPYAADEVPIIAPPTRHEAPAEMPQQGLASAGDVAAQNMTLPITPSPAGPGLAQTIITWAGKGGVGKSTTAFSLAQRAAKAGLRVILVDANFGQGDMRTFLRIGNAGLPSIYQAALSGDLKAALVDPDTLNATRSPKLDPLGFALVQAPPAHLTNPDVVTPEVYMNVVEQARQMCDLVVIDTQIIEATDQFGMVTRFVEPLFRAGAWGVGISDLSSPGISNLLTRLKAFAGAGISRERQTTMLNRISPRIQFNIEGVASAFNEHSVFLGTVYADDSIPEAMNRGRAVSNNLVLAPILDAALNRVTGLDEFSPNAAAAAAAAADMAAAPGETKARGGGFLARLLRSKDR